jgi:hypothetical protein
LRCRANSSATSAQISEFKKAVVDHAANLSGFGFSSKTKAINYVKKHNQLAEVLRDALMLTRASCFNQPNDQMKKVAVEQFNFTLEVIAKKIK